MLKVISRVRSQPQLGFELKLRDLMQKPCIAELSGFDAAAQTQAPDPLLALNGRVADMPALFCLHAGFGTVFDYEPLARRLDGRRTVYGLQCRMLLDPGWQDASLQAMAEAYAARIRQQQPHGPYHLLGWSLGGALALLVARELEGQGQRVEFAGLVDTFVAGVAEAGNWREDLRDFLVIALGMVVEAADGLIALHASGLAEAEGAARVIEAAMDAPRSSEGDHGLLGASELVQIFAVGSRLKALSLGQASLPSTQVAAHCWWVAGRDDERRVFEGQVRSAVDRVVAAGHYELLQQDALLAELEELLSVRAPQYS